MRKFLLISLFALLSRSTQAQNSPFLIWGTGLDGSTYQTGAIYSQLPSGLTIEAPLTPANEKTPISITWRGGGTPPFFIDAQSNVGIGTTSPDAKLGVNGLIRAREIKVETLNWPDYVFKPSYKLPSLSAVRLYIKRNGHLPELPSEATVAKDGVSLGEMNKLLLKKVEELTLHMIRLQVEVDVLKHNERMQKNKTRVNH